MLSFFLRRLADGLVVSGRAVVAPRIKKAQPATAGPPLSQFLFTRLPTNRAMNITAQSKDRSMKLEDAHTKGMARMYQA